MWTKSREVPNRGRCPRHTGARGRAVAAVMAHFPASVPPNGVVRVRVEEYEKLMGSMLEEAERRIAEAVDARDRAVAEAQSLRSALEASERRESSSAQKFETWRAALVDAAAEELAVETTRWRAVVAEKDAAIAALSLSEGSGASTVRSSGGDSNAEETRVSPRGGVASSGHAPGGGSEPRDGEEGERSSATPAGTPPRAGAHRRNRSLSAAPVAESPAALVDAARKAEASAKVRAAAAATIDEGDARLAAARSDRGSSGAGGLSTDPERKEARTETTFGFWSFW